MNLCTSTLSGFDFQQALEIAVASGCQGIELRVADSYHKSLRDLSESGASVAKTISDAGLGLAVLNSYIPIEDESTVDALIDAARVMGVPQVRVVLPRAARAAVASQANINEGIPSYHSHLKPNELINRLKASLLRLEEKARSADVQVLLELHWGTVMSSFSSAFMLVRDLDPKYVGITFDPANMMVEGKEDWEYGLALVSEYIANVHVKNVSWKVSDDGWTWEWAPMHQGMLDWPYLIFLIRQCGYEGGCSIEDFRVPCESMDSAIAHIRDIRSTYEGMCESNKLFDIGRYGVPPEMLATI
ncbi:MAG TPA: sugar phosphate isomerase/epimerase [Gammaproteobacteria bacterium]|nr:sugar phosphate isomerase/epimerase [Gammaproteobacteria bacterium]